MASFTIIDGETDDSQFFDGEFFEDPYDFKITEPKNKIKDRSLRKNTPKTVKRQAKKAHPIKLRALTENNNIRKYVINKEKKHDA